MPSLFTSDEGAARLEISNLFKNYGDKTVVNELSLTIYENEIMVILGHNGAGKTTTLNMLTGLTSATSGQASVHNLTDHAIDLFADYSSVADLIGLCPQDDVLFDSMTVRENLVFYAKLRGIQDIVQVVTDHLERYNLAEYSEKFAKDLPVG